MDKIKMVVKKYRDYIHKRTGEYINLHGCKLIIIHSQGTSNATIRHQKGLD